MIRNCTNSQRSMSFSLNAVFTVFAFASIHHAVLYAQVKASTEADIADPSWKILHWVHPASRQGIWHLAFSPDGKTIASAAADKTTRLWDVATGRLLSTIQRPVNCKNVAFSPNGKLLAIAGGDHGEDPPGELVLWNLEKNAVEFELLEHPTSKYVCCTVFSNDGKYIAAGGSDEDVRIWDVSTGKLHRTRYGHQGLISSLAFSPDGTLLASGSFDKSIRIWDLGARDTLSVLDGHENGVRSVSYSPDGKLLLSTSDDKTARLWDTTSLELIAVTRDHNGFVLCGAFSPDGSEFVTAGKSTGIGHRVVLRDVAQAGESSVRQAFPLQTSEISSVAFSPKGDMLAIAGGWNSFQIWKRTGK